MMRSALFATAAIVASAGLLLSSCGQAVEPTPASATAANRTPEVVPKDAPPSAPAPEPVAPAIIITPPQSEDLNQYSEFTYQSATAVGLPPAVLETANTELAQMSDPWISEAVAQNDTRQCPKDEETRALFNLALTWEPCDGELLCVRQTITKVGIGMATGDPSTAAVRIDPTTGRNLALSEVLQGQASEGFLAAVNDTVKVVQRLNDFVFDGTFSTYDADTLPTWLPQDGGITVWFPKYELGSGALGIVETRFEPTGDSWDSWVVEGFDRVPILTTDDPSSSDNREGVKVANKVVLAQIFNDLEWQVDPLWCRKVTLSNREPLWGVFESSKKAYKNPAICQLSDSFGYVGKVDGTWRFLDYPGSSVSSCESIRESLGAEGVPPNAVEDIISNSGCPTDDALSAPADPEDFPNPPISASEPAPEASTVQLVEVPGVVGLFNKDAEALLTRAGLRAWMQAQIGDPSIAAQVNNHCVAQDQNPPAGSMVERNTQVTVRMQCPNTGYNAPAPPQPWSG